MILHLTCYNSVWIHCCCCCPHTTSMRFALLVSRNTTSHFCCFLLQRNIDVVFWLESEGICPCCYRKCFVCVHIVLAAPPFTSCCAISINSQPNLPLTLMWTLRCPKGLSQTYFTLIVFFLFFLKMLKYIGGWESSPKTELGTFYWLCFVSSKTNQHSTKCVLHLKYPWTCSCEATVHAEKYTYLNIFKIVSGVKRS